MNRILSLTELGFSDADTRTLKAKALHDQLKKDQSSLNLSRANSEEYSALSDRLVPLSATKSSGSTLLDRVITAMEVDYKNVVIEKSMINFFVELDKADPKSVQCLLQSYIANNLQYTSKASYSKYQSFEMSAPAFDVAMQHFRKRRMQYIYAHAYTTQYVSPERRAQMKLYCEEIRIAFSQRISNLDWISETTKQKAKEKLEAMLFNVGYPDKWIESALPSFKGTSLLEDMMTLVQARGNQIKEMLSLPAQVADFHEIITMVPIGVVNAMYTPDLNTIHIFPAWMLDPLYDESMSDAYNYAIFSVIGHEMTHGFDSNGAKYNKIGKLENWWTASDQMEFMERHQKLIECYNILKIMPVELPGVCADGRKTLSENIADLGGALLVCQAYNTKLQTEGYKDEELKKQQKKFFQAYANLWRSKYTAAYATKKLANDEHSLLKERLNGTVMNIDQWYDLYDVKWGDKLYLKPERRSYIW